jgi:uroporphyrinogen decarboxylase
MYDRPDLMHRLLAINAEAVTRYLNEQIRAGAQAVQIFDSWGGALADGHYQTFSLAYMRRIVEGLIREHDGRRVPVIVFTKGGGHWLEDIAATGCDAIGLDWTVSLGRARARVGHRVALQGNLDPVALFAQPAAIEAEVARLLADYGHGPGHVFNLGHGISQFTPPEHVTALCEAVQRHSRALRAAATSA